MDYFYQFISFKKHWIKYSEWNKMHPMQRCNKIIIKNNYKESSHYFATYNERTITVTILLFSKSNLKLGNRKLAGPVVIVSMVLICLCDGEEKIWNGLEIPFDLQHQLFPCKLHFNWVGIIHLLFYYKLSKQFKAANSEVFLNAF